MIRFVSPAFLLCGLSAWASAQEPVPQDPELQRLRQELTALQQRLTDLEARPAMQLGPPPQIPAAPVGPRGTFDDRQTPAARPDNLAVDPELEGFFPVFGSSILMKINAKPRVDVTWDNRNTNNQDRFVPALFPLPGDPEFGGGGQFNINANATQFSLDVRDPENANGFRFYYQNDFFGEINANMRYRLQHAYGQTHNVVAGFTYGVFEDPDIWPDTIDYEGPNALIFARRPVLQYLMPFGEAWSVKFGVEQPDIFIDNTVDPAATLSTRAPDVGFNVRWAQRDTGHMQASALFRSIGVNGAAVEDQHEFAWGLNLSAALNVTETDDFGVLLVGGEGIGGLGNDSGFLNTDAAIDASGDLVALPYYSAMVSFRHRWTGALRSTATYGYVSLDTVAGQAGSFYETSQYASANLIYAFSPNATVGLEVLYGDKTVRDDRDTDAFRVQFSLVYWLF